MMRSMVALATLALVGTVVPAQTTRPERHPWARWQVGSWVETSRTTDGSAAQRTTRKLTRIRDTAIDLEDQVKGQPSTQRVARNLAGQGSAHTVSGATKVDRTTLTVAGKTYECTVWKAYWKEGDTACEESVWQAAGHSLPLKITIKRGKSWQKLSAVAIDDRVAVGSTELDCVKYEGKRSSGGTIESVQVWRSLEIPGGVVKEIATPRGGAKTMTLAVDFHGSVRDQLAN